MPSEDRREPYLVAAIGIVAVLILLYSILIARAILAGLGVVIPLVFLYLVWRFVRAHERVADALESDGEST